MMQAIRDEIRAILREELAALREGAAGFGPQVETVSIASDSDLNRFALEILDRASDAGFVERLRSGQLRFECAGGGGPSPAPAAYVRPLAAPSRPAPSPGASAAQPVVHKPLLTERELVSLARGQRHLRISRQTRLTPLAQDEARRLGIRIERCEA